MKSQGNKKTTPLLSGNLPGSVLVILGVILFAACATFYIWLRFVPHQKPIDQQQRLNAIFATEGTPQAPEGKDPLNYGLDDATSTAKLGGYIFFTAGASSSAPLNEWVVPVIGTSTPVKALPSLPDSSKVVFADSKNPTSTIYLSLDSPVSKKFEPDGYGLHKVDLKTREADYLYSARSVGERDLAPSPDGKKLLYGRISPTQNSADTYLIDNRQVAIVDVKANKLLTVLPSVTQARWSPDGTKLLLLRTNGVYVYDIATQREQLVVPADAGTRFLSSTMMDLSEDGTHLVVTNPKSGVIVMEELAWNMSTSTGTSTSASTSTPTVASTTPMVTAKELGRLHQDNTAFYWPRFSQDGMFYAVQAVDTTDGISAPKNARIEIRPTTGRTVVKQIPLEGFYFGSLFTDSWRNENPIPQSPAASSTAQS